jgi:mono/diheme cytochrome c family protein/peroxiredoxin
MSGLPRVLGVFLAGVLVLAGSALAAWLLRSATAPAFPAPAADQLQRGQLLYTVNCIACHGHEGRGDGPSAAEQNPPPTDLTAPARKHGTGPDSLRRVIRHGVPSTAMAANSSLSDSDLDCLVFYVELLAAKAGLPAETVARLGNAGITAMEAPRDVAALEFRHLRGEPLRLADLRGKVVLLNFWSTTCVHCLDELPALERIQRDHGKRGLAVISVCYDETDAARVEKLARRSAGKLPIHLDPTGQSRLHFDLEVMPVVFVLDRHGRLAGVTRGARGWSDKDVELILSAFPK